MRNLNTIGAKRDSGGFLNYAPDGDVNLQGKVTSEAKKIFGRDETWIEQDPNLLQ